MQNAYFQLVGINSITLQNVFASRFTSVLYSSLTVTVVYFIITRISNYKIGVITASVLLLEPYALKYSRIGIIDSAVVLFVIISFYLFIRANRSNNTLEFVFAGIFFGVTLITKELGFYLLVVLVVWYLITRFVVKNNVNGRGIVIFLLNGLLIYLGYVSWALSVNAKVFVASNVSLLNRALGFVRNTGYTAPNYASSFTNDVMRTVGLYLMTYMMLALSAVFCIYLLYRDRNESAVFFTSLLAGSALFFGSLGIHNPQFLIYLTIPAAVIAGYTLARFALERLRRKLKKLSCAAVCLLVLIVSYNAVVWYTVDGTSTDNAFSQSVTWIEANIPKGQDIYVSNNAYYFLFTDYHIFYPSSDSAKNTLNVVTEYSIHYFILSPGLEFYLGHDLIAYVKSNGTIVSSFEGYSYGQINIYYIDKPIMRD